MTDRLGRLALRLRPWWWVLLIAAGALLLAIPAVTTGYGDVQTASSAQGFRALVADAGGRGTVAVAALVDIGFATAYGALALAVAALIHRWNGNYRRLGLIGCALVGAGAVLDLVENLLLLRNLLRFDHVGDVAIELMVAVGTIKWAAGLSGGLLVVGVVIAAALWRTTTRSDIRLWVDLSWVPYGLFVATFVGIIAAAVVGVRWLFWPLVLALLVLGSWANLRVRESRLAHSEKRESDLGPVRLLFAVLQLGVGVVLVLVGDPDVGYLGDGAMLLGGVLVFLSLGTFVSELRQNQWGRKWLAPALLVLAVALWLVAALADVGNWLFALLAAGLVVGELGTEMTSERFVRWARSNKTAGGVGVRMMIGGGVAALASLVLVIGLGADPLHALGLVAILAAVVAMATVDGDALIVVALLAVVLIAATRPDERDVSDDLVAAEGAPYVLVLGDSYTSGEGAREYLPGTNLVVRNRSATDPHTNECRQAPTAWPFLLAQRVAEEPIAADSATPFPSRVLFLACSGATTENIDWAPRLDEDGDQHGPAELALYLERATELGPPTAVVIGIGGNDGGFGDLGAACVGPGNCAEVAEQFLRNRPTRLPQPDGGQSVALSDIEEDLRHAYRRVRDVVGENVPVIATAYPLPATTGGRCAGALLEDEEREFINAFAERLNTTIREVAQDEGVHVMGISGALADEGVQLCGRFSGLNNFAFGSKGGELRDRVSPANWIHNSLHPNAAGQAALQRAAYRWLDANWPLPDQPDPVTRDDRTVDQILADLDVDQCDPVSSPACSIEDGVWATEQARSLLSLAFVPLALLSLALWLAILPVAARLEGVSLLGLLRRLLSHLATPWGRVTAWWHRI